MSDTARRFINTSICILVCGLFVMGCGGNPNLIGCPDCCKRVSKKAFSCPECGLAAPGLKAEKLEDEKKYGKKDNDIGHSNFSVNKEGVEEKLKSSTND